MTPTQSPVGPIEQLKAMFAREMERPVDLTEFKGGEWWQLLDSEAEVFELELADMPALVAAWHLYEAVADMSHTEFHGTPLCIEVRAALPYIELGRTDVLQWEIFARLFGIGGRKARAWFYKFEFSMTRSELDSWNDDDMPMPRAPVMSPLHWPEFWQAPRG